MERAFEAANTVEDRQKTQEYLQKRLFPMLNAGNAHMVNWDNEPLPHEKNYELAPAWTPANKLPHQANGFNRKKSPSRRRSDEMSNSGAAGGGGQMKRARRDSDGASSDSDNSDPLEKMHFSSMNQVSIKLDRELGGVFGHGNLSSSAEIHTYNRSLKLLNVTNSIQKKTKAQKKAEKAARKAAKKLQKQQTPQKVKNAWKVAGGDTEARRVSWIN